MYGASVFFLLVGKRSTEFSSGGEWREVCGFGKLGSLAIFLCFSWLISTRIAIQNSTKTIVFLWQTPQNLEKNSRTFGNEDKQVTIFHLLWRATRMTFHPIVDDWETTLGGFIIYWLLSLWLFFEHCCFWQYRWLLEVSKIQKLQKHIPWRFHCFGGRGSIKLFFVHPYLRRWSNLTNILPMGGSATN